ncbi:hypothetical protein EBT31_12415 [bacterium]|nr:hypothetical protein [bacterium]
MKRVRLFVLQDNCRSFIDVPYGQHAEAQAELEMFGAQVYHSMVLSEPAKQRKSRTGARLKQRMY